MYSAVLSTHINPLLSGVAKFNSILARELGVPFQGFADPLPGSARPLLVSPKLRELSGRDVTDAASLLSRLRSEEYVYDLFFHTYDSTALEEDFVATCRKIYCANEEVRHSLRLSGKPLILGWCPGLLEQQTVRFESPLNFFSFGMAHKIQLSLHERLISVLKEIGADYTLWLSTAFHEKANFGDFSSVSRSLVELYGDRVRFLGFLSDEAVNYFLGKADALFAFFEKGIRSNNTSVLAAMERGCPVVTNLDGYSPKWLVHGDDVLDVSKLQADHLEKASLKSIGKKGRESVLKHAGWTGLVDLLRRQSEASPESPFAKEEAWKPSLGISREPSIP